MSNINRQSGSMSAAKPTLNSCPSCSHWIPESGAGTIAGLKEVAKLQKLEVLSLHDTKITDVGLKEVAKLQQLKELQLDGTKVTKAGVAELKKALPICKITGP